MPALSPGRLRPNAPPLPAWQLYGEHQAPQQGEPWHLETIWARSRLHDWEIRPHRHEAFQQFLHMEEGRATLWLEGQEHGLVGPCVVQVPPMAAHGFRFEPQVQGHVLTLQQRHLEALLAAVGAPPALGQVLARPAQLLLRRGSPLARQLHHLMHALAEEYSGHTAPWRAQALDAGVLHWLLAVARALPGVATPPLSAPGSRAALHLERYRALVASRFRLQPRVADLAAELGLTVTQLNRICQATLGQSALGLLHARMLLEAQRQLAYTTQSIKQIALELGFGDPAYFSRFFQRLAGKSPQMWRQTSQQRADTHQSEADPLFPEA